MTYEGQRGRFFRGRAFSPQGHGAHGACGRDHTVDCPQQRGGCGWSTETNIRCRTAENGHLLSYDVGWVPELGWQASAADCALRAEVGDAGYTRGRGAMETHAGFVL